eukprot:TRINITY_DN6666_c0_g1_i1.p1 TRINITY_DN6666_c0_g1~~TRINITY_DN6666_c0_g1_i1.p1  ORF type:complete len:1069 (+),score=204.75 TRINITY_DN6666_c0_g1_i1:412-3207(+)
MLCCAQFLDAGSLVDAVSREILVWILHSQNSPEAVLACLGIADPGGSRGAASSAPDISGAAAPVPAFVPAAPTGALATDALDLLASAPALGDRAAALVGAWAESDEGSDLARLSADAVRELLVMADGMTRQDPGVCEILCLAEAVRQPRQDVPAVAAQTSLGIACSNSPEVRRALDLVSTRSQRYKGSLVLMDALIAIVAAGGAEVALPAQVKAIHNLTLLAHPMESRVIAALLVVLEDGHLAGGALCSDDADVCHANADESNAESFARRMGLDAGWELRVAACASLEEVALPGDKVVVTAAAGLLGHGFSEVRYAAVQLVSRLVLPGCAVSVGALVRALRDDDWRVREAAGIALANLTTDSDAVSIGSLVRSVCHCLADDNPDVRQSARSALRLCFEQCGVSNVVVNLDVNEQLGNAHSAIRVAAIEALGDALAALTSDTSAGSKPFDDDVVSGVIAALGAALLDLSSQVRQAAAKALCVHGSNASDLTIVRRRAAKYAIDAVAAARNGRVGSPTQEALDVLRATADRGDALAVSTACSVLTGSWAARSGGGYGSDEVELQARRAACLALRDLALLGDGAVLEVLSEALAFPTLREDALAALDALAVGSPVETDALMAVVADAQSPSAARGKALRCLTRTAAADVAPDVLDGALALLDSSDPALRGQALCAAARLAPRGEEATKNAVIATLRNELQHEVQERAMVACEALLERGDFDVIETIVGHVVRGEFCTRQSGLRTLERIAGLGNARAIHAMLPWLEQGHWPQRQAALDALPSLVSDRGHEEVNAAVVKRLSDSDETCRQSACETLGKVAALGDAASVHALTERLENEMSWIVRDSIVEALATLATRSQAEHLLQPLLSHMDPDVQRAAEEVLAQIDERKANEMLPSLAESMSDSVGAVAESDGMTREAENFGSLYQPGSVPLVVT